MKALIFSAGLGTRFKPWTDHHPKALALVNGKSLLQRNIEYLQSAGITDIVVNVHHFPDQIMEAVEISKGWGSNVVISDERDVVLETGGGLVKARHLLEGNEPFLTWNVDILTNLDLDEMIRCHQSTDAMITLAVTQRNTSRKFLFNTASRLCGWRNNSNGEERLSVQEPNLIEKAFSGIAVYHPEIFPLIRHTGKFSIVETFLDLAATQPIYGFDHTGSKWVDVGRVESVGEAEAMFPI